MQAIVENSKAGESVRSNHCSNPDSEVDPAILLLITEMRRGNDSLKVELVGAVRDLGTEVKSQGRLAIYLSSAIVVLALVSMFGVLATRGVDPGSVAKAVHQVAPAIGVSQEVSQPLEKSEKPASQAP